LVVNPRKIEGAKGGLLQAPASCIYSFKDGQVII